MKGHKSLSHRLMNEWSFERIVIPCVIIVGIFFYIMGIKDLVLPNKVVIFIVAFLFFVGMFLTISFFMVVALSTEKFKKNDYRLFKKILYILFLYLLSVLINASVYNYLCNDNLLFWGSVASFYTVINNEIINPLRVIQLVFGSITNTVLLSLFVTLFLELVEKNKKIR